MVSNFAFKKDTHSDPHLRLACDLVANMTLAEKIGQMGQVNGGSHELHDMIRQGGLGSVLNEVDVNVVNELQRIAVEESRLGIPLLIGRDVIHGFKTIFPIPLGQAASWNAELIEKGSAIAASEAASTGVNWTFAPMIDICRDPRWGRIAECLGEDPHLASVLGAAMVKGFQGDALDSPGSIGACAKHFAGYGAGESGMDYATVNLPESELRNVYLPPFKAAVDAGIVSFMTAFNDLNGVPASANDFLTQQVLREEWSFDGLVVSDWDSISQLTVHGFTEGDHEAALVAAKAGVDMEMASRCYADHLELLVEQGQITEASIDLMVTNILKVKSQLGLFENPYTDASAYPALLNNDHLNAARQAATQSVVMLQNNDQRLPLSRDSLASLAVIGPLANDGYEQLGTWVFDGEAQHSRTCLQSIQSMVGDDVDVRWSQGMVNSRCRQEDGYDEAIAIARGSDVAIMVMGEESILSGEAHCRADIDLPGGQEKLIDAVAATGTPIVLVIMAGRPLTLSGVIDKVDAILYAWHPGTMGGPAIADLIFGVESPSGRLPVSFPRMVGQIPIYYARKNTGRPATHENITHIDEIDGGAEQTSLGMSAFHLDAGFTPQYPFGYGLSYTKFEYTNLRLSSNRLGLDDTVNVTVSIRNIGEVDSDTVVQLYIRDLVGSITRPIRELKGFKRIHLRAGEEQDVSFELGPQELGFYGRDMQFATETGRFHLWVGGDSDATLWGEFELVD